MSPAFDTLGGRAVLADVLNVVPCAEAAHASPFKRHKSDPDSKPSVSGPSIWSQARQQLRNTTSAGPPQGREQQYERLSALLNQFEEHGDGCSVYVSGVPGTGKSYTVSRAVQQLQTAGSSCGVVWINCMSATSVADVCSQVLSNACSSTSTTTPPKQQQVSTTAQLSGELAKLQQRALRRGRSAPGCSHVLVLDEIDHLLACGPQAMYDLFLLPQQPNLRVLVIGIANSIDLTERALPQLKLLGCTPELLCFTAYTTKQITAILEESLSSLPCRVVERPALELLARSVASSSGDLRAAIKAACTALRRAQDGSQAAQQQLRSPRKQPQQEQVLPGTQQQLRSPRKQPQEQVPPGTQQQLRSPSRGLRSPSKQLRSPGKQQVMSPLKAGAACGAQAALVPVGVRDMMAVLSALTGAGGTAAAASQLSKLPTQQQLLLYCLCVLCPGASSGASTTQADLCCLWGLPPPAGPAGSGEDTPVRNSSGASGSSTTTPGGRSSKVGGSSITPLAGGGKGSSCRKRGRMERAGGSSSSVGLSTASMDAIWQLNLKVAKTVGVSPLSPEEVSNQLELMAQMALVDLVTAGAGPAASPAPGAAAAAGGGRKLLKPQRLFLHAAGRKGGGGSAATTDAASGGARAGLRVAYETVLRSFKTHPLFRKLLGTESA